MDTTAPDKTAGAAAEPADHLMASPVPDAGASAAGSPVTGAGEAPSPAPAAPAPAAMADGQSVKDAKDMKLVVMDSAELATRAASMAADAGINLRTAVKDLSHNQRKQNKWTLILLASAGGLMLVTAVLFAIMSMRIQARVAMLDEMLVAVGKRVTEMDASLELIGGAQESLKTVITKQGELLAVQSKIDARLEQVVKSAQDVPEQTAKQVEARMQALSRQVAGLESRFQSQSSSAQRMATQLQSMQGALGDAGSMKRELEALARQQRERQAQEAAQAAKSRERLVQYPRQQSEKP